MDTLSAARPFLHRMVLSLAAIAAVSVIFGAKALEHDLDRTARVAGASQSDIATPY